jgi:uncharacterized membrane protein YphA (DoxX/SURF4 family)/predicted enzyme related to lactoylglutathione lyase
MSSPGKTTPTLILDALDHRATLAFARFCLASPFLVAGIFKLLYWDAGVAEMANVGLPYPADFNIAALVTELAGSALVLINRWTWLGAGALGIFTAISTALAHRFWELAEPARTQQMNSFLEHAAICAAFILVVVAEQRARTSDAFVPQAPSRRNPTTPLPIGQNPNEDREMRVYTVAILTTLSLVGMSVAAAPAQAAPHAPPAAVAVAPQYDTAHVYVAPGDVDRFAASFLATFGGKSTKQVVVDVTPTPSQTSSQLLQTPVGTVSLFGFRTPIPYPFGAERTGYLVTDLDAAIRAARTAGADIIVASFPDPIGRDAVIQWPGGVNMQLYWHGKKPNYAAFQTVPENRVYVSPDRADAFVKAFLAFSHGHVAQDDRGVPGSEIGQAKGSFRQVRIESTFGKLTVLVTDGHLPYPYGRETTGYDVPDLDGTLARARASGASVLVGPTKFSDRIAAMVSFPGGYIAELHTPLGR